ncbi:MAG: hypothetical protein M3M96_05595 [Candidatus Eremiobacteraeota bacterium]|nr:hypothetical protein [Candidatus Eremiobacteraeota bacterium]
MPARSAGDKHLKMAALCIPFEFLIVLLITAVTAEGGTRVPFKGALLMLRRCSAFLSGLVLSVVWVVTPASAARPIVDVHSMDEFFALFAPDSNVPWKASRVRLDTYSGAPVDFSAYQMDPADVLVAGANARPRPVSLLRQRAVASWRYRPRPGFRYQSSDVTVPLGAREGFFVVAARRGKTQEQIWINRTRIGLLSKQTSGSILLYGADLGTGRALPHMRVSFVSGRHFVTLFTNERGMVRWSARPQPVFALAQWGSNFAFLSFPPRAPEPGEILGVRLESAVVHSGEVVRIVGFARVRTPSAMRPSGGVAGIELRRNGQLVTQTSARLDAAGAFTGSLRVPLAARAGEYVVLASHGSASAGASLHVDADEGGVTLSVLPCESVCPFASAVPVTIRAMRGKLAADNLPVRVFVVRAPHVLRGQASETNSWGTVAWFDDTLSTDAQGMATFSIPRPTDGLASTYGIHVESAGATADTRAVVPTARVALALDLNSETISAGSPLPFRLTGYDVVTGQPAAHLTVRVALMHGANVAQQSVTLDAHGLASGSFSSAQIGSDLVVATAEVGGETAKDARGVLVEPQARSHPYESQAADIAIDVNRERYKVGETVTVRASEPAARGDALMTLESSSGVIPRRIANTNGRATATFTAEPSPGETAAGAAFVADGSLRWSIRRFFSNAVEPVETVRLLLDQPSYAPGQTALVRVGDQPREGTMLVRIARGTPSGSAIFDTIAQPLGVGGADSQNTAPPDPSWHSWVDAAGSRAQVMNYARRGGEPRGVALADANTQSVMWKMERKTFAAMRVTVPDTRGTYTISAIEMDDDGRVAAASANLVIK